MNSKPFNVLYVSCVCSVDTMNRLFETALQKPHPAPQKYHAMMVAGLNANGNNITCLTTRPVTKRTHPGKLFWGHKTETDGGVKYDYISFINHPLPKLVWFKIYTFFYTLVWLLNTRGEKAVVCDVLNSHANAAMWACRMSGSKCVGIVTDIPGYMNFSGKHKSAMKRLYEKWQIWNIRHMTHFAVLTKQMNEIVNPHLKKPFVVVEGVADGRLKDLAPTPYDDGLRHITYTGTLNEAFGVRLLLDAFTLLPQSDVVLDIYGNGPMAAEMKEYEKKDGRIRYHGTVSIEDAVKAQRSSFLLVNPRTSAGEFTRYSFPSKNMEYMATGVPLLTVCLPGIPEEYFPHLFLFKGETIEDYSSSMQEILSLPIEETKKKGIDGKDFVMSKKSNVCQASKLIELLNNKN